VSSFRSALNLLPYLIGLEIIDVILVNTDASMAVHITVSVIGRGSIFVLAGYQVASRGGNPGTANWTAFWTMPLDLGIELVSLPFRSDLASTTAALGPHLTSAGVLAASAMLVLIILAIAMLVIAVVVAWPLAQFGYWVGERAA
jgi:hypothetical protein